MKISLNIADNQVLILDLECEIAFIVAINIFKFYIHDNQLFWNLDFNLIILLEVPESVGIYFYVTTLPF